MPQSAPELRRRADAAAQAGRFAEAADLYRREAAIYRKNGDPNGALVEEKKADRYSSSVRVFLHLPDWRPERTRGRLAKFEPPYGCYLGAFIDRDERLGESFTDENFQKHQDPDSFAQTMGKAHASVFCYVAYGKPFPTRWVERLKRQGVAPHIAFEPNQGLAAVRNDTYLRDFAQAAARADCPIFLRYASEMNGDWTRYGGNPAEYKAKFMLVADVFRTIAPNVAMLWCVNVIPQKNIPDFYPGDDYVDWVGVNFYAVPFYDNDPTRSGQADNPADNLKYIYERYAAKKPIAIGEFGASHFSTADNKDRPEWAAQKIHEVYASLPRLYPRVKLIDIFDMDNMKYAEPGRQLNNYSVTDSEIVRREYARAIAPDYFLSRIGASVRPTPIVPVAASGAKVPAGPLVVSAWARCYDSRAQVAYLLDGKEVAQSKTFGPREATISLAPGKRVLTAVVKDSRGQVAAKTNVALTVG